MIFLIFLVFVKRFIVFLQQTKKTSYTDLRAKFLDSFSKREPKRTLQTVLFKRVQRSHDFRFKVSELIMLQIINGEKAEDPESKTKGKKVKKSETSGGTKAGHSLLGK